MLYIQNHATAVNQRLYVDISWHGDIDVTSKRLYIVATARAGARGPCVYDRITKIYSKMVHTELEPKLTTHQSSWLKSSPIC